MHLPVSLPLLFAATVFLVLQPSVNAASATVVANKMNQNFFSIFSGRKNITTPRLAIRRSGWWGRPAYVYVTPDPNKIDLLFVMDNSGSIGSTNFVKQKTFVSLMVDHVLTVTCSKSIRIAVISFATSTQITVEFDFNDYSGSATPRAGLKNAVNGITYVHGSATNTAGALDEAHSLLNDVSRGARSDATRVVFVLTDGSSNQGGAPGPKAAVLRNTDGAVVFAMGVANFGSTSSQNELKAIASNPDYDYVLDVDDFGDMDDIAAEFGAKPRCNLIDLATHRPEDWNSIVAGLRTLKQNGVINTLAALHAEGFGSAHGSAGFLPWHRAFVSMLEYAVQIARNDISLRLPYWNWAGEYVATSAIWAHLGGSANKGDQSAGNCVNTGHFSQVLWHPDPSECIIRNIIDPVPGSQQASQAQLNSDRTDIPIYENFRQRTETEIGRHDTLHNRFGWPSDMRSVQSPRDPLFFLNHCFIDKLWYDWQQLHGDGPSNYPDTTIDEVYNLYGVMDFLTAAYPGNNKQLLKQPAWNRPVHLLKVGDLGYTYDQSSGSTFGRKKRATSKSYVVSAPQLSVSYLKAVISSRRPTQLQVAQWDFDTQCWFESDRLTPSQQDLCIRRGIIPGIRLVGGPNRFEGRVEILVNGHYHAVCGDGWNNVDANVLCGQLGYSTGQASSGYKWGYIKKSYVVSQIKCAGTERYIQDCGRYNVGTNYRGGYCPGYRYAEVKCNSGVRFTRNGVPSASPNGYLQVYDSSTKRWGPVCGGAGWGNRQRTDACEQVGYGPAYYVLPATTLLRSRNSRGPRTNPRCLSSTDKKTDCNAGVQWGASSCSRSSDNLYISCQKPIRLVGRNSYEGRVEVFNRGVWGSVCDTYWDSKDAEVVCRQLGHNYGGTALRGAYYGRGHGPVWLDRVTCQGREKSLTDCKHSGFGRTSCSHGKDAAVRCRTTAPVPVVFAGSLSVKRPLITSHRVLV